VTPRYYADVTTIEGRRVLVVGPEVTEDAPPMVREGLARRALVAAGESCPCGARMALPSRAARRDAARTRRPLHVNVEHEPDCAAVATVVTRWLA